MKINRRIVLIVLILGFFTCLIILFRAFLYENFVQPISLLIWILQRVLASVDQNIYWGGLLFLSLIILLLRLGRAPSTSDQEPPSDTFSTLENIRYWRTAITVTRGEVSEVNVLKRYLGKMLATAYAVNDPGRTNLEIYNALKLHQIPLPDSIYAFLFPGALPATGRSISQMLQSIRQLPKRWARRWSGRELEEYYQSIGEVLAYIESTLEVKSDDQSNSNNH